MSIACTIMAGASAPINANYLARRLRSIWPNIFIICRARCSCSARVVSQRSAAVSTSSSGRGVSSTWRTSAV